MKRRTNIEMANPAAPLHACAARRWFHNSQAVTGSQTSRSSHTNG
jgi:hypothetical protein